MASRKFFRDWRLEEDFGKNGRVRKRAVYVGETFVFETPQSASGKRRGLVPALAASCWIFFFLALAFDSRAARTIFLALPFAVSVLPLLFLSGYAVTLFRTRETLTRETAEKLTRRMPACAVAVAVLSGFAFFGGVFCAFALRCGAGAGDLLFIVCSAALCAAACAIFVAVRRIKVVIKRESV